MKTVEYSVANINGNIESETLFLVEGNVDNKKMDMIYIDKQGKKYIYHKKDIKSSAAPKVANINPINLVKTFVNNNDEVFKQINLN